MAYVKNILIYIVLSVVVVLILPQIHWVLHGIDTAHQYLLTKLDVVFAGGTVGRLIHTSLALILVPLIIALIPLIIYRIIRRQTMPHFMMITWIIWLILTTMMAYR